MLLTITNLNVYSFVGSYTMSSLAIITMDEHEFSHSIEKPNALLLAGSGFVGAVMAIYGITTLQAVTLIVTTGIVAAAIMAHPNDHFHIENTLLFNGNDYSKYDFSEFDN